MFGNIHKFVTLLTARQGRTTNGAKSRAASRKMPATELPEAMITTRKKRQYKPRDGVRGCREAVRTGRRKACGAAGNGTKNR